jgi:aminopeptidase-like protein
MHDLIRELLPLPRSLTGDGVRATLARLSEEVPLETVEVPTGTPVYDWTVPREWNVREAWVAAPDGRCVVDFADSTLHLLGYSVPVRARLPLAELREHLHVHPDEPDWIPYRTSYWQENWGFCLTRRTLESLADGEYEVAIDATLSDGHLTYGEAVVAGETDGEVLISTYVCHPALCNDNLSGVVLAAALGKALAAMPGLRYTYRLLWSPGTIGPLTWLSRNEERLGRIRAGLVVSCAGDPGGFTYKRSRRGDAEVDRAVAAVLRERGGAHDVVDFAPWGGDERQFCSPGFDLPVGAFSRTPADRFRGYHSSADDLGLVRPEALGESLHVLLAALDVLETNARYRNLNPKGEPQLGRRGLYRAIGGGSVTEQALLWVLNLSDGGRDLLAIAEQSGLAFAAVREAARKLEDVELLERLDG